MCVCAWCGCVGRRTSPSGHAHLTSRARALAPSLLRGGRTDSVAPDGCRVKWTRREGRSGGVRSDSGSSLERQDAMQRGVARGLESVAWHAVALKSTAVYAGARRFESVRRVSRPRADSNRARRTRIEGLEGSDVTTVSGGREGAETRVSDATGAARRKEEVRAGLLSCCLSYVHSYHLVDNAAVSRFLLRVPAWQSPRLDPEHEVTADL